MNPRSIAFHGFLGVIALLATVGGCCCVPDFWSDGGGEEGDGPFESTAPRPTVRLSQEFDDYQWEAKETLIISAEDAAASLVNDTIRVSPDGRHYAFAKKVEGGIAWFIDGKPLPTLAEVSQIVFTPDGSHYLAGGTRLPNTEGPAAFLDGKPMANAPDTGLGASAFVLSHDGRHQGMFWNANYGSAHGYYIDGKKVHFNQPTLASYADGISWLYAESPKVTFNGKDFQVVGTGSNFMISPSGKSWGYVASQDGKQFAVIDSVPRRRFNSVAWSDYSGASPLVFSPNGKRWGHPAGNLVVIDDKIFDLKGTPALPLAFSPDSKTWVCRVTIGQGTHVVVNGKVGPAYATAGTVTEGYSTSAGRIAISPDSRHVAYSATRSTEDGQTEAFAVLDDDEQTGFGWVSNSLIFSPDSQRLAYLARTFTPGKGDAQGAHSDLFVAIDGKRESDPYPEVLRGKIEFSPDSNSLGFVGVGAGEALAVLDGEPRARYDAIAPHGSRLGFTPDNTFTYIAVKGGAYYWVEERRK